MRMNQSSYSMAFSIISLFLPSHPKQRGSPNVRRLSTSDATLSAMDSSQEDDLQVSDTLSSSSSSISLKVTSELSLSLSLSIPPLSPSVCGATGRLMYRIVCRGQGMKEWD